MNPAQKPSKNRFSAISGFVGRNSKSKFLVFVALFGLVGGLIVFRSFAATTVATIEADSMVGSGTVVTAKNASGKKALKLTTADPAKTTVSTSQQATQLVLRAKGNRCGGIPEVSIVIDNKSVFKTTISSNNDVWAEYTGVITVDAGVHQISANLTNPYSKSSCTRWVMLDTLTLLNDLPPPPPADTQAPTVSISSPTNNAQLTGTTDITATATDNVGVTNVQFFVDGNLVSSLTASPFIIEWDTANVANGQHTIKTVAYDAFNNSGTNSITVTLNQVKPQIRGVVDRDAYNTGIDPSKQNLQVPATHRGMVNNFVLLLKWNQLQPSGSADLDTTKIDDAIAEAKANNMRIKIRILAGIHSPTWVKNLEGGPFTVYDIDKTTLEEFSGTAPKYWTTGVKNAYSGLMSKLAAKYDKDQTVGGVVNSLCSTIFAEPFIKNLDEGNNMASFYGAGLTDALDQQCLNDSINIHNTHWKTTRTETAINPLSYKGTDSTGKTIEKLNVDFSLAWEKKCREVLGERCVMGNNGFNATAGPAGSNYRKVVGGIICAGDPPPYFQTRQLAVIQSTNNTLASVLEYAKDVGAGMVEVPVQYRQTSTISLTDLTNLDAALETNHTISCPADQLLPNPI